jgi:hypothetical protein
MSTIVTAAESVAGAGPTTPIPYAAGEDFDPNNLLGGVRADSLLACY